MALTYPSQSRNARPYLMPRSSASPVSSASHSHSSSSSGGGKPRRPEGAVMDIARGLVKNAFTRPQVLHVRNNDGDTFFHVACRSGYNQVVSYMLESAPPALDLDEMSPGGFTPLAYAARGAFQDIVKQLVAAGADITLFERSDRARFLPPLAEHRNSILRAIESGRNEYVRRLSQRLMALDFEPWKHTPEVLINIIVDYVCAPPSDMPVPSKKKSVSKASGDGEFKEDDEADDLSASEPSLVETFEQSFASAAISSSTSNARPLDAD